MEKDKEKGKKYCLRLLSLRPRTDNEIRERLKRKGYSIETVKLICADLKKASLIDDAGFAKSWIEYRLRTGPRAQAVLRDELVRKGVSEGVINDIFGKMSDELKDERIAERLVRNASGRFKKASEKDKKIKFFRMLLSRGFDETMAEEVIERELLNTKK